MCEGCTKNITTGKRHIFEYIPCPEIMDNYPGKIPLPYSNQTWKSVSINVNGVQAFTLQPFRSIVPKIAVNQRLEKSVLDGVSLIQDAYISEKLDLQRLLSLRHPMYPENPYFRQIFPCRGYLMIANTYSDPQSGVVKIYGEPDRLTKIVYDMLQEQLIPNKDWEYDAKAFACNSKSYFNDEKNAEILLSKDGIMKINGGYAFIVAPVKKWDEFEGELEREVFCFMNNIDIITKLVRKELERKNVM